MISRLRDVRLFWKILVPFLALMLAVAVFGTFVVTRTLATRAQSDLDQDLGRRSLEARATLRDRELSVLESATLTANLEGMAEAVREQQRDRVQQLADSVMALKTDLDAVVVADAAGVTIVELVRRDTGVTVPRSPFRVGPVDSTSGKRAAIATIDGAPMLAIAAPICTATPECAPTGTVVVGASLAAAAQAAHVAPEGERTTVTIYGLDGKAVATAGPVPTPSSVGEIDPASTTRRTSTLGGERIATLFSPYSLQGQPGGWLAVSLPADDALSSARDAAVRLALIVLAGMLGVVVLGALVSRLIVAQVRPIVDASRRLGQGDFAVRVPVHGEDELGELASGVNRMAEQLQASYETLESRVDLRTAEVQRLLRERTEFFASISHELRTPLAVIIAQAEVLGETGVEESGIISDAAAQLLALVNDILDLARAEAGRLAISPCDTDVAAIVDDVRPTIDGLTRAGEISVDLDVEQSLSVWADPLRIRAVLVNLVDNAVKYTPPGGHIQIRARRNGPAVEVSVSDTGIGIPPEIGDRLFEPFFRVPNAATQRGQASSGLGLALARRLVEAHGGDLSYVSDGSSGATFTFTIPVDRHTGRRRAAAGSAGR